MIDTRALELTELAAAEMSETSGGGESLAYRIGQGAHWYYNFVTDFWTGVYYGATSA
jgi:hypothetical protein